MTLLFDQNISYKIAKIISDTCPNCIHVSKAGLTNASDDDIWTFAKKNNHCIVTFDSDFLNIATLKGHPPKIIHLKTGNRKTFPIAELLITNKELIESFLYDTSYEDIACLEIAG